jgi:enamine deaminase RidA (YjgF/YER057c/UK114 family)
MTASQKLAELNLTLPAVAAPIGSYVPGVRVGDLVLTSGQLPLAEGKLFAVGKVGQDVMLDRAQAAARCAGLNALAIVAQLAGGVDRIKRIVRLAVFVNSAPGFTNQPKVANGASDLMVEIFGDAGRHVRAAVGVNELPLNAAVEVELVAEVAGETP